MLVAVECPSGTSKNMFAIEKSASKKSQSMDAAMDISLLHIYTKATSSLIILRAHEKIIKIQICLIHSTFLNFANKAKFRHLAKR